MEEKKKNLKHCVYCGANTEGQVYCPNCGKMVVSVKDYKSKEIDTQTFDRNFLPSNREISRKCSGCGALITSTILEQCPICNTNLDPLPIYQKQPKKEPSFIFTDKKLQAEKELIINKEIWNIREGLKVFTNCIWIYFLTYLMIILFILFQMNPEGFTGSITAEVSIYMILLAQIPGIVLGIYPLWYISKKNHKFEKLGFKSNSKKIILAFIIGIIGGIILILINYFSNFINTFLIDMGLDLLDINSITDEENKIIRESDLTWLVLLFFMIVLQAISTEIVFRGVLHNSLLQKFQKNESDSFGRVKVILIVALVYSCLYIVFYLILGVVFFILNFLVFLVLGFLYEINRNIYNTIIASIFYNILIIGLIYFI